MSKGWTPERRAAQAARIRELKPWTKSTGPRTKEGKKRASQNAFKHGHRRSALRQFAKALRHQRDFMRLAFAGMDDLDFETAWEEAQTDYKKKCAQSTASPKSTPFSEMN